MTEQTNQASRKLAFFMLTVQTDSSGLDRYIGKMTKAFSQATVDALNWTIYNVRDAHREGMSSAFDRPTPFTLNLTNRVRPATLARMYSKTEIRDDQSGGIAPSKYLAPSIFGGDRSIKRMERALQARGLMPKGWYAIPGKGAKLDAFGNMSRGQIMQVLSVLSAAEQTSGYSANQTYQSRQRNKKPGDYFSSNPYSVKKTARGGRLPYGIYQRTGKGKIVTILRFRPSVKYKARFDYWGIAQAKATQDFPRLMRKAAAKAFIR